MFQCYPRQRPQIKHNPNRPPARAGKVIPIRIRRIDRNRHGVQIEK